MCDLAVFLLCGLSGPFCLFLLPVAVWQAARRRGSDAGGKLVLLALCGGVQAALALSAGHGNAPVLGASPVLLADIVALQIVLGTLLGRHRLVGVLHGVLWRDQVLPIALCLLAGGFGTLAWRRGSTLLRQFSLYAALLVAACLLRPATGSSQPAWVLFASPDLGDRYYVIPMLCWVGVLFSLATQRARGLRITARALVAAILLAIPGDLHFATPLATAPPTGFDAAARSFALAPRGTRSAFPVHPQGARPMLLTRH